MKKQPRLAQPGDIAVVKVRLKYQQVGYCSSCFELIEALQPGGLKPRHIKSKTPYGDCRRTS